MASDSGTTSPDQQIRQLYERAERDAAQAAERLVGGRGFGQALALLTENVVALTRVGNEGLDLALRNLRLAGRRDLTHLATQINRTEDKLERVLQEVEALRDEVAALRAEEPAASGSDGPASRSSASANGSARSSSSASPKAARSARRTAGSSSGGSGAGRGGSAKRSGGGGAASATATSG